MSLSFITRVRLPTNDKTTGKRVVIPAGVVVAATKAGDIVTSEIEVEVKGKFTRKNRKVVTRADMTTAVQRGLVELKQVD